LLSTSLLAAGSAHAQSVDEKLRSQLRSTVQELRQLQDNQAQLQTDKAAAEKQRDDALAQVKDLQAQLAAAKGESTAEVAARRALAQEKTSHAEDAKQLAKYKTSYEDLLTVSRARDAEHTQLQNEFKARDTQLQSCEAKNADLYRVGHEILDAYEHVGFGTFFASREPFAQSARVKYDDIAQRYGDALYAGKYDPNARTAPAATSGGAVASQPSATQ
jgi:chromosome segregation ATPase